MVATVAGIHLGSDTHANRPAGNAVPDGSLYSCSTHSLIYKSNFAGNSWATWGTLGAGAGLGAWTTYTPTLTASTTNPTLGSSTIVGRYKALDVNTYLVQAQLNVVTGGAWNAGSGEWRFALPSITSVAGRNQIGSAYVLDSGTRYYAGACVVGPSSTFIGPISLSDVAGGAVIHNLPVTWATSDIVAVSVIVEV